MGQHCFGSRFVTWLVPSLYVNQCYLTVNWTVRIKLKWILNENAKTSFNRKAFQNAFLQNVCHSFCGQCGNVLARQNHQTAQLLIWELEVIISCYFLFKIFWNQFTFLWVRVWHFMYKKSMNTWYIEAIYVDIFSLVSAVDLHQHCVSAIWSLSDFEIILLFSL